jgi:putative holliday junction resolvase
MVNNHNGTPRPANFLTNFSAADCNSSRRMERLENPNLRRHVCPDRGIAHEARSSPFPEKTSVEISRLRAALEPPHQKRQTPTGFRVPGSWPGNRRTIPVRLKCRSLENPLSETNLRFRLTKIDPAMTRVLGLDYGTKRVGAALSDPGRTIAFPVEVYTLRGPEPDARHYREVILENGVERIVLGLALHTSGREGKLAALARRFGDWLAVLTGRPVMYFDERYTTAEAERRLIDAGLNRRKRKELRDKLAAQIMLQSYLDAGCPETQAPATPLFDPHENRA